MRGVASKRSSLCVICVLIGINWWKEAVMWVLNTNQPWRFCESVRGKLELKWTHEGSLTRMGLGDREWGHRLAEGCSKDYCAIDGPPYRPPHVLSAGSKVTTALSVTTGDTRQVSQLYLKRWQLIRA